MYLLSLKTLKSRLMGTAEHHKERSVTSSEGDETDEQKKYKTPAEFHKKLARFVDEDYSSNRSVIVQSFFSSCISLCRAKRKQKFINVSSRIKFPSKK